VCYHLELGLEAGVNTFMWVAYVGFLKPSSMILMFYDLLIKRLNGVILVGRR